ncbi:hypothetical protein TNCT_603281 [Trichonephila clavata]|uniref:Uncharacterized protein n=1 Tax=Trichonephila clavata TaxID=2740835 RepID=A0A8X6J3N5_TRICU|nr:hypothetical protein TNCT_603281 [Trichonephila clavata]
MGMLVKNLSSKRGRCTSPDAVFETGSLHAQVSTAPSSCKEVSNCTASRVPCRVPFRVLLTSVGTKKNTLVPDRVIWRLGNWHTHFVQKFRDNECGGT